MTASARLLRAGLAWLLLAALTAGIPAVLWLTLGNPADSWDALRHGDVSDQVVLHLLAVLGYLAWALWAAALGTEIGALARERAGPITSGHAARSAPPAGTRRLARSLLVTALLLAPATATVIGSTVPAFAAPPAPTPTASTAAVATTSSPSSGVEETTRSYVVPAGDGPATYWDLAASILGDGAEWHRIWDLNRGRTQADGTRLTDPDLLRPGWTVLLPADATLPESPAGQGDLRPVEVRAGDTFTGIAADAGVENWHELWSANQGREEPDGQRWTDPDLIRPGWTVLVPGETTQTVTVPPPPSPRRAPPPATEPAPAPAPTTTPPPTTAPPTTNTAAPEPTNRQTAPPPTPVRAAPTQPVASPHPTPVAAYTAVLGGGLGLLAATTYLALRRYRRRQIRRRAPGRAIPAAPAQLRDLDAAVQITGTPALGTVELVDRALRALALDLGDGPPPRIRALSIDPCELHLMIDTDSPPPEPWRDAEGQWHATRGDVRDLPAPENAAAPCPTLVSAVHGPDSETLIHLAEAGIVIVTGDPQRATDWLRFVAGELAHNTWSDHLGVTVSGLEPGLVQLNPARLRYEPDILSAVRALHTDDTEVLLFGPGWHTEADALTALHALDTTGSNALVAYLPDELADAVPNALRVRIDAQGAVTIPALGLAGAAPALSAKDAAELGALLASARDLEPEPIRPAAGISLLEDQAAALFDVATLEPAAGSGAVTDLTFPSPRMDTGDEGLDADLTAWRDADSGRAKLTLLGPVTLTAHGRPPDGRRAFYTEVITYLALHPRGVSGDRFAADLWPERNFTARDSSPKNAMSIARKWLGTNPLTGTDYLPAATANGTGVATYRLNGLLVDWDLFRRLRARGQARGADSIDDFEAALSLVTGEPHSHRRPDGYGWLRDGSTADEDALSVAIVDTAHAVASAALAVGDLERAQHAVDVALSVGPADDRPLLDQASILDAQGRQAELAATVRRIRAHHEAEVEEDLPPSTYEVLLQRGWLAG